MSSASVALMSTAGNNPFVLNPLTDRLLQVMDFRRPDNWSGNSLETPCDGDLSHLHTLLLGQLFNPKKT